IGSVSVIENMETGIQLQPALAHGLVVAALVCFSFSISFHIPLWGIELLLVVPYIVSQLFGVVLGAAMAKLMTTEGIYARAQGAAFTILQTEEQLGQAVFGEIAMTCLLTVVARCCQQQEKIPLLPFLVGCTVIISVLPEYWSNYWTYHWVGPTAGSLMVAALVLLLGNQKMQTVQVTHNLTLPRLHIL
uniref:Aquaporin 8b n=1 Tax=Electrophorus electricus TaxID=8005 RepID=A0A4W4EJ25_ELEEL